MPRNKKYPRVTALTIDQIAVEKAKLALERERFNFDNYRKEVLLNREIDEKRLRRMLSY